MKFSRLFLFLAVFTVSPLAKAEFASVSLGPDAVHVLDVVEAEEETVVYMVTSGDIYRTEDDGNFWTRQNILQGAADVTWAASLAYAVDTELWIREDDSGWQSDTVALPDGTVRGLRLSADSSSVYMIAIDGAGDTSLWGLAHGGETWLALGGGLPADTLLDVMATSGGVLVATATQGVWLSDDGGATFDDTDQPGVAVADWASDSTGTVILMTDGTDIYRNTAGGVGSWTSTDLGGGETITGVGIAADGELLAGTDRSGLFAASSWPTFTGGREDGRLEQVQANVPVAIGAIGRAGDDLLVGTLGRGVFIDPGLTANFVEPSLQPDGGEVLSFARGRTDQESILGTRGGGVFLTLSSGGDWSPSNTDFNARDVHALLRDGETIFAGTDDGIRRAASLDSLQWEEVGDATLGGVTVYALMLVDTRLVAATGAGIFYSDDQADTWTQGSALIADTLADDGTALWAAGDGVFVTSANDGATWAAAGTTGVTGTPRRVFVASDELWLAVDDGLYRSADQAASWTEVVTGVTPTTPEADYLLVFSDSKDDIYFSEATAGLRVSFDDGASWRDLYLGLPDAGGGAEAGIRAYSEVIPDDVDGEPSTATPTLHLAPGGFGMYGSTIADQGDFQFLIHPGGDFADINLNDGNLEIATVTAAHPDRATAPAGVLFSLGFYRFTISGIVPGQAVEVTITFPTGASPDVFYKYGPEASDLTDHWYDFAFDGTTGAEFDGETITLHFVDGGRGDSDGEANGVIVDPGAPGYTVGTDSGGGAPSPLLLGALMLLIARRVYSAR
jgi:hypothetical protein